MNKGNRQISLNKADQIFDWLLANKKIQLKGKHNIPSSNEFKGKEFCKWYNTFAHATNNCVVFRNIIQDQIEAKDLRFPERNDVMEVDINPFPSLVDLNVLSINLSSVFSMQAQGVSWNTITANHLFNDLVGAGVLRFPIFCDESIERFCRWHLKELHTTDQCQIFKNFLIKQTARETVALTESQISALGLEDFISPLT